jgi:hypothetical protein
MEAGMNEETLLREKIRKLEALFAGAGTPGEKDAAEAGLERIRARLGKHGLDDRGVNGQRGWSTLSVHRIIERSPCGGGGGLIRQKHGHEVMKEL